MDMQRRDLLKSIPALAAGAAFGGTETNSGKSRLRSAICAYSFRNELGAKTMTYEDLVRLAVELDTDGLDLTVYWFSDTSDSFLLPLRRLAYKSGVEIYSISIRTDMCQPTAEQREQQLASVKKYVDAAEKLGASHIRVFGGRVPKEATEDQAAEWVVEVLKRASDYSGTKGVVLGLENHGGITERADRILQIVRKVDSPWVGVNLDTGNFNREVLPQIEKCVPYAVNVQVKAEQRREDGTRGPQDWARIIQLLRAGSYKGYLALEYEAKEPAPTAVPKLMHKLQSLIRA
jgi:sugar phosphate isomerase/epimerase